MHELALASASLRCLGRRLSGAVRAAPLPTVPALALVVAAPLALARVGGEVGAVLAPALSDAAGARGVVISLAVPALAAGATLALAAPGLPGLGPQIAAAPVGIGARALASLVPVAVAGALLVPAVGTAAVAFARSSPGGVAAGASLACACLAVAAVGLVLGESGLAAVRGSRLAALVLTAAVGAWAAAGAARGDLVLGPLADAPRALAGTGRPLPSGAVAVAVSLLALVTWSALSATRPAARPRSPGGGLVPVAGPVPVAVFLASAKLLHRRGDVRLALAAGVLFGASGIGLGATRAGPETAAVHLAGGGAGLAAALAPLAVAGVLLDGRETWLTAPARRVMVAVPACLTALLAQAWVVLAVAAGAAVVLDVPVHEAAKSVVLAVSTGASALLAGALVPWRGERLGDQLASFASFGAVAAGVPAVGLAVAGPLDRHGVAVDVVAPAMLGLLVWLGIAAVALRVARRA